MRVLLRQSARLVMGAFALACAVAPVLAEEASTPPAPPAFPYGNDPDVAALVDVRRVRDPLCLGWTNGADQCRVQPDRSILCEIAGADQCRVQPDRSILCEIAGVDKKRGQIWCDKPNYEALIQICPEGFYNGCQPCGRIVRVNGQLTAACRANVCGRDNNQTFPALSCLGMGPRTPIMVRRK